MFRSSSNSSVRKSRRLNGFESLEPRALMSATQVVQVHLPPPPAALAGLVATPNATATKSTAGTTPAPTISSGPYTPAQIRSIYGFDKLSYDGTGTTIAIVDAYDDPTIATDLHTFDAVLGLPNANLQIVQQLDGNNKPPATANNQWRAEISLDVEWAHAIAPGAKIMLCEATDAYQLFSMVDYARKAPGVSVVSMSFTSYEPGPSRWGSQSQTDLDNLMTTPDGHIPVTFVAGAGDTGYLTAGGPGVGYPASSPNVLAVGGTTLHGATSNLIGTPIVTLPGSPKPIATTAPMQYGSEVAWSGSGGGISVYEARPAYQAAFQNSTHRTVPDVAYDADPNTPYLIFDSAAANGWTTVGGTSAGTPQWAALVALANQGRATFGGDTLAYAVSDMYALPATDFHDITSGNNGFYSATKGYDEVTGRGTPIANLLVNDLIHIEGGLPYTGPFHVYVPPTAPISSTGNATLITTAKPTGVNIGTGATLTPVVAGLRQAFLTAEAMSQATHGTARHSHQAGGIADLVASELFAALGGGKW